MRTSYLGLTVSDLAAWKNYVDVYGLAMEMESQGAFVRWGERQQRLVLTEGSADDIGFCGLEVDSAQELDAMREALQRANVPIAEGTPEECGIRAVQSLIHFVDPNNIRFEICTPTAKAEQPFKSPVVQHGFVEDDQGFGHAALNCTDLSETEEFWTNLGARVSDYITIDTPGGEVRLVFLRFNRRHHSIAYIQGPFPPIGKSLNHFEIQVLDKMDVGRANDRVRDSDIVEFASLGQHPNDLAFSFYSVTPSGFLMEIGAGCLEVDENTWEIAHLDKLTEWGHHMNPAAM